MQAILSWRKVVGVVNGSGMPKSFASLVSDRKVKQGAMIAKLHLRVDEYNHMVACGAFDRLDRRVQLIRGEILESTRSSPTAIMMTWSPI